MRKVLLVVVLVRAFAGAALAAPQKLSFGKELNAAQCVNSGGTMAINVVQGILNDGDSGFHSPVWAMDTLTRHIQVWQTGTNTFCA